MGFGDWKAKRRLRWVAIGAVGVTIASYALASAFIGNLSVVTHGSVDLTAGNIEVPSKRTRVWAENSDLLESTISKLASKDEKDLSFGTKEIDALIAQLCVGKNIEQVNQILLEAQPWGDVGSGHDYDFTLCGLVALLYRFGDEREILYPRTVDHIVTVLLTETGGEPARHPAKRKYSVLKFIPIKDTENHILMTEGSRFLTNQWLVEKGNKDPLFDNSQNGLEHWLLNHLAGMEKAGVHEYNSIPYEGYTLRALLNLASFADGPVAEKARGILDRITWTYALGSLSLRRRAPFRRSPDRADETRLDAHYQTAMMKGWLSLAGVKGLKIERVPHHAMWVALTSYRPPDAVADWAAAKKSDYFIRIGHGSDGSPEIYSGGPGYLISAGGVANAVLGDSVARQTTLMLEDGATDLKELLHLQGLGENYRQWNHTGVHERFAVAAGPVWVPEHWIPAFEKEGWRFYERAGQRIAVYSGEDFGLFCLLSEEGEFEDKAQELAELNSDAAQLKSTFQWPGGSALSYDLRAKKGDWVMTTIDNKPLDREHGKWALMQGELSQ